MIDKSRDSKTNTNGEQSKSPKSTRSSRKKSTVSGQTIILSIERDINDLLQEISIRSQKNKLFSIQESLKLLSKRIATVTFTDNINEDEKKTSVLYSSVNYLTETDLLYKTKVKENETLKQNYEREIKELKDQIANLKLKLENNQTNLLSEQEETIHSFSLKNEQLTELLREQKNKNNSQLLHIKKIEDALKAINEEYNMLSTKYGRLQDENENLERVISDTRRQTIDNKTKYEEIVKINSRLKEKLSQNDSALKLHMEDLKSLLKKNCHLQKLNEELEAKCKTTTAELNYKEERLKALRHMNAKLEQQSNRILKKWENLHLYEDKTTELSRNNKKMVEVIDDINNKLFFEAGQNEENFKTIEVLASEKNKLLHDNEEVKKQLIALKQINDELIHRNKELETKLRYSIDNLGNGRDLSQSFSINRSKSINNFLNKEIKNSNEISLDDLKPARIVINKNTIELK